MLFYKSLKKYNNMPYHLINSLISLFYLQHLKTQCFCVPYYFHTNITVRIRNAVFVFNQMYLLTYMSVCHFTQKPLYLFYSIDIFKSKPISFTAEVHPLFHIQGMNCATCYYVNNRFLSQ